MNEFKQKVLTASVDRYVLTKTQCEMLRQDAEIIGMKRAPVLAKDGSNKISRTRTCSSCWIPYAKHHNWIYNIMREITDGINAEQWRFDTLTFQSSSTTPRSYTQALQEELASENRKGAAANLVLPRIDELHMGQLFQLWMLATMVESQLST